MKFDLHKITTSGKVNLESILPKSGETPLKKVQPLDEFMNTLVTKIKDAKSSDEADKLLLDMGNNNELEMIDYTMFKHDDYHVETMLNCFGEPVANNLKTLKKLNLNCVPELVETIKKDNGLYLITKMSGTKDGNIKPYFLDGASKVSKEAKLDAYHDMQKLTKSGYIDSQNLKANNWYYTPENKIMLPNWQNLRKIQPDESQKEILETYYKILFNE